MEQTTIARRVQCRGTGLHGGEEVDLALEPAEPDTGVVFVVPDPVRPGGCREIPARASAVRSSARATTLSDGAGASISTVEHLLATLSALGVDNVRVELSGDEVPGMDGSARPLVDWVRSAGRRGQAVTRRRLRVRRGFEIREGERSIRVEPADGLSVCYAIDFDHPCIGRQSLELAEVDEACFERELAGARTFGFQSEIETLRASGLALGGSFANAIVLDERRVLNDSGLRWPDEFVRHKVIDLLGDLALLGAPLEACVRVERGGHRLHHRLVAALLDRADVLEPIDEGRLQKPA